MQNQRKLDQLIVIISIEGANLLIPHHRSMKSESVANNRRRNTTMQSCRNNQGVDKALKPERNARYRTSDRYRSLLKQRSREVQFEKWNPDAGIAKDGTHVFHFKQEFPLEVFSYRFPYYYSNIPNYHNYLELTYICAGTGICHISNQEYSFGPSDVAVIGSDEVHCIRPAAKSNLDMFSIFFMPEILCPQSSDESKLDLLRLFRNSTCHVLKAIEYDHATLFDTMIEMQRLDQERPKFYRLHLKYLLFGLLLNLLHHYDDCHLFGPQPSSHPRQSESAIHRLNPVFNLVENHYRERISLDQAAQACNMSRNYFCRFFKNVTGTSFVEYLNTFRINQAKQLIVGSDLTATQVAYQVGYNNLGYFFRSFKKHTNLRPKEFAAVQGM